MAKQNYRCAGCGIRTDPGKSHHNDPRTLSSPTPVLGDGRGERTGGGREEVLEQEGRALPQGATLREPYPGETGSLQLGS